jgi:hypothetical protein
MPCSLRHSTKQTTDWPNDNDGEDMMTISPDDTQELSSREFDKESGDEAATP